MPKLIFQVMLLKQTIHCRSGIMVEHLFIAREHMNCEVSNAGVEKPFEIDKAFKH